MAKIAIDPITRIEGHLRIEAQVEDGKVVDAEGKEVTKSRLFRK